MHKLLTVQLLCLALLRARGCDPAPKPPSHPHVGASSGPYAGYDRNEYPGDDKLAALHQQFAFTGYWLTPPPGGNATGWLGKRALLRQAGFGFAVLADGRADAALQHGAATLGTQDGTHAAALAHSEGFPPGTLLFLDQEEGGRLLPEQSAYLQAWAAAVAATPYKPGAYLSGQPVPDGKDPQGKPLTITTAQDVASRHLGITLWVYNDTCPPAPGCTTRPPSPTASGTPSADLWQYAQSPRRLTVTASCVQTYAPDGNCYAASAPGLLVDLDTATSPDPSHGR